MRLVVKVGTSTIAYPTGHLNIRRVEMLCKVLSDIANAGNDVILVSSGAIGVGAGKLGMMGRPPDMPTKQAAAAIGQSELMYEYDKIFSEYNHTVAQILLTAEDVEEPQRCANFRSTIFRLLELHAIPIINENDTVATAEIALGDNDTLGAIVASVIRADLLVLMSDIDGLYSLIPTCTRMPASLRKLRRLRRKSRRLPAARNISSEPAACARKYTPRILRRSMEPTWSS